MIFSLYSFFMAVLWFSVFILIGTVLQRKTSLVICGQLLPLILLLVLTVFRLVAPIETSFAHIVGSTSFYPWLQAVLREPWFTVGGKPVPCMYVLLGIWTGGSVALCLRLCLRLFRDSRTVKAITSVECQDMAQYLKELRPTHRRNQKVKLIISSAVSTPMLVGLIRPRILLPQMCVNLPEQELLGILSHELTHLSNGDLWTKLFVRVLCCLMWWNPCVYLLQKDLDSILEYKCDLAVTKNMRDGEKVAYLQTVLAVLSRMEKLPLSNVHQTLQTGFCGIPEETILKQRFQLVLHQGHQRRRIPTAVFIVMLLALFTASYSVVLQPVSQPPAEDLIGEIYITFETSYILAKSDGTYYLVYEGEPLQQLLPDMLRSRPFCNLTILNGTMEE
ncbi:hypothetical protein OBV_32270 [Oscillibacter valericigenes Sjm18-20]|nr:hypothetical protein OBV_32270 [Oscillibacter valericigenes Sjm18-20]